MKKIHVLPSGIFWVVLLLLTCRERSLSYLVPIAAHEASHVLCAKILKKKIKSFSAGVGGLLLELSGVIDYKSQFFISLSGPLGSFLFFAAFYGIFPDSAGISLALCLVNLLPASGFDGYGMLSSVLCSVCSQGTAEKILSVTDGVCFFIMCAFSLFSLIATSLNVSSLILTSFIFCRTFLRSKKTVDFSGK